MDLFSIHFESHLTAFPAQDVAMPCREIDLQRTLRDRHPACAQGEGGAGEGWGFQEPPQALLEPPGDPEAGAGRAAPHHRQPAPPRIRRGQRDPGGRRGEEEPDCGRGADERPASPPRSRTRTPLSPPAFPWDGKSAPRRSGEPVDARRSGSLHNHRAGRPHSDPRGWGAHQMEGLRVRNDLGGPYGHPHPWPVRRLQGRPPVHMPDPRGLTRRTGDRRGRRSRGGCGPPGTPGWPLRRWRCG